MDVLDGVEDGEVEGCVVGDWDELEGGKQISKPSFWVEPSDLNVNVSPSSTVTPSGVVVLPQYFVSLTTR
jgi:hypothetical protein